MVNDFAPVVPPAWGTAARSPETVLESIDSWLENQPLAELVGAFGGEQPRGEMAERLAWLDDFSATRWDYRAGQERNLARSEDFDDHTRELVLAAAKALQLMSTSPPERRDYTHVLILGGLVRACILRPQFAAKLVDGGLQATSVAALSAYRDLRGDENDLIRQLEIPEKRNEMEVMEHGLVAAFGLGAPESDERHTEAGLEWATSLIRTWRKAGLVIQLVIAPSPEPLVRRANTADTYAYWADVCAHIGPDDTILLVTSSIYLPFQHADAVRMLALPHGCSVETVGIDFSDHHLGALRQPFKPTNYLQEIRSAIRSVRALHAKASEMLSSEP